MNIPLKSSLSGAELDEVVRAGIEAAGYRISGPLKWAVVGASEDDGPTRPGRPGVPCVEFTVESNPQSPKLQIGGTRVDVCGLCGGTGQRHYVIGGTSTPGIDTCARCKGTGKITTHLRGA